MSDVPQLFTLYKDTLIFRNRYGQEVDGQAVDTWIATEGGERWYEVIDCTTPDGDSYDCAETDLRRGR
jgi:NADPH:quinone reductase-like Zn-dependent oxidoreductase